MNTVQESTDQGALTREVGRGNEQVTLTRRDNDQGGAWVMTR